MSNQWQKEVSSQQSNQQEELPGLSEDKKIKTATDLEKEAEATKYESILGKGDLEETLFKAVSENNQEAVETLIEKKPQLNLRISDILQSHEDSHGDKTLLSLSVMCSNPKITKLLLEAGADPNIPEKNFHLAAHHALCSGAWEQAIMLLKATNPDQYKLGLKKDYTGLNIAVKGIIHRTCCGVQPINASIPLELIDLLVTKFEENPNSPLDIASINYLGQEYQSTLWFSTLSAMIELGSAATIKNLLKYIPNISHNDYIRITTSDSTYISPWLKEALSAKLGTTNEQALIALLDGLHNRLGENSDLYKVFRSKDSKHNIAEKKLLKVVTDFFDTAPTDKKQASSTTTTPSETPHTPQPG